LAIKTVLNIGAAVPLAFGADAPQPCGPSKSLIV
jgi:hypothetical protein